MSSGPLVSFVVINYNYGVFLEAAIASILQQSYDNFECIIIDNSSTDDSELVLERHEGSDPRLRVLRLEQNLNQMGAFLFIIDQLSGDLVTIVDSDDFLFTDYAAEHVKVHSELKLEIAFSSSAVIEIDAEGHPLTTGYDPFLVSAVSDANYAVGSPCAYANVPCAARIIPPTTFGWHWSPGTANMHNRSLMMATRPRETRGAYVGATDNYFMWLNHAIKGSATISLPLSAYRIHGRNRFGSTATISGLRHATPAGTNRSAIRRRDITRELTKRVDEFVRLAPGEFWRLMDVPAAAGGGTLDNYYANPHVVKIIGGNLDCLKRTLGEAEVERELTKRMGRKTYRSMMRAAKREFLVARP